MGILHPIYTDNDLKDLTVRKRQELSQAIFHLLQTDPDVKKMLREKTAALYDRLKK